MSDMLVTDSQSINLAPFVAILDFAGGGMFQMCEYLNPPKLLSKVLNKGKKGNLARHKRAAHEGVKIP